jgi:hypothetical protein
MMATLRVVLAVIDNAEAVPVEQGWDYSGTSPTEVPRRAIAMDDVLDRLHEQVTDRRRAAAIYREVGELDRAEEVEQEAAVISALMQNVGVSGG